MLSVCENIHEYQLDQMFCSVRLTAFMRLINEWHNEAPNTIGNKLKSMRRILAGINSNNGNDDELKRLIKDILKRKIAATKYKISLHYNRKQDKIALLKTGNLFWF